MERPIIPKGMVSITLQLAKAELQWKQYPDQSWLKPSVVSTPDLSELALVNFQSFENCRDIACSLAFANCRMKIEKKDFSEQ